MSGIVERMNNIVINNIKSEYIRKYLTEIKYKFSLEECVTLILNDDSMKLNEKMALIKEIEESDETPNCTRDEIDSIIADYNCIEDCMVGEFNSVMYTECNGRLLIYNNINAMINKLDEIGGSEEATIIIIDSYDSSEVAYIEIRDKDIVGYTVVSDKLNNKISRLYNKYVYIPNDLDIGDIVKTIDNDRKYIVVNNGVLDENMREVAEYPIDSSVMVVPIEALSSKSSYKEQIQRIMQDRINNNDEDYKHDTISLTHEHIALTHIEKM